MVTYSFLFAYKVVSINDNFSKKVVLYRRENAIFRLIGKLFEEYEYRQQIIKKYFDENLIMFAEDKQRFQSSSICWICNKLFDLGDSKIIDHNNNRKIHRFCTLEL